MLAIPDKLRGYNDVHLTTFKKLSNDSPFEYIKLLMSPLMIYYFVIEDLVLQRNFTCIFNIGWLWFCNALVYQFAIL